MAEHPEHPGNPGQPARFEWLLADERLERLVRAATVMKAGNRPCSCSENPGVTGYGHVELCLAQRNGAEKAEELLGWVASLRSASPGSLTNADARFLFGLGEQMLEASNRTARAMDRDMRRRYGLDWSSAGS